MTSPPCKVGSNAANFSARVVFGLPMALDAQPYVFAILAQCLPARDDIGRKPERNQLPGAENVASRTARHITRTNTRLAPSDATRYSECQIVIQGLLVVSPEINFANNNY